MRATSEVFRTFLAVVPGDSDRAVIGEYLRGLEIASWPCRGVRPDAWHVGLRFLGSVDSVVRERFLAAAAQRMEGERFRVRITGPSAFPRPAKANVVWLGVDDPSGRLGVCARDAEEIARSVGLSAEERPYRPHMTVARCRPQWDARAMIAEASPLSLDVDVRSIGLYRSHLGQGPARYELIDEISLRHPRR